jgi:hypothetical protein
VCYQLVLSTDSIANLAAHDDALISFSRELPDVPERALLQHAQQWYLRSRHGCSCGFRHLFHGSVELGFGEPVDWYPEDADDLAATLAFVAVARALLAEGARLDCIDAWDHRDGEPALAGTLEVDLRNLSDRAFRFFENHRFAFVA